MVVWLRASQLSVLRCFVLFEQANWFLLNSLLALLDTRKPVQLFFKQSLKHETELSLEVNCVFKKYKLCKATESADCFF